MRPESNPLDLNNLPEDYSRDGHKPVFEEGSSSGLKKNKNGAKDGKDDCSKVYECRFCSLKFCKSQALGGHMNRHRQERETETLNQARQLVYKSENNLGHGGHLGCHTIASGSYLPGGTINGDPYRSVYPPSRLFSGSSSSSTLLPQPQPPPHQPYIYTSPSRISPYPSHYTQQPFNDYYIGHVLNNTSQNMTFNNMATTDSSSYTCIGAPVGHNSFGPGSSRGSDLINVRDGSLSHHEEGLNWGRSYPTTASGGGGGRGLQHQRLDHNPTSSISRFQDGF